MPKIAHYEILRDWLEDRLTNWHRLRQPQFEPNNSYQSNGTNGHFQVSGTSELRTDIEKHENCLASTYDAWKMVSDKRKQEIWLNECAKAFAREQEKHKETRRRLDLAEQKIQLLRAQLGQAHRTPETDMYSPSVLPISRETADYLPNSEFFSYEGLLSKWKTRVQATRSTQQPLPLPSSWTTATSPNLNENHQSNGVAYPQQKRPDPQFSHRDGGEHHPDNDDEDLVDAPGDEDDLGQDDGMEKDVLDPSLRDADADGDVDGEAGGRMLMGLREYDGPGVGNGAMDIGRE